MRGGALVRLLGHARGRVAVVRRAEQQQRDSPLEPRSERNGGERGGIRPAAVLHKERQRQRWRVGH